MKALSSEDIQRIEAVQDTWREVLRCTSALVGDMRNYDRHRAAQCWYGPSTDAEGQELHGLEARTAVEGALLDLRYGDVKTPLDERPFVPTTTMLAPGVLACGPEVMESAHRLRDAKAALLEALQAVSSQTDTTKHGTVRRARYALQVIGEGSAHLQNGLRSPVLLPQPPKSIGFSWSLNRHIKHLTGGQLRKRILDQCNGATDVFLDKLDAAGVTDSTLLAEVRVSNVRRCRARVRFDRAIPVPPGKVARTSHPLWCALPLMYLATDGAPPTIRGSVGPRPDRDQVSDPRALNPRGRARKIEPEPLIGALNIHRVLQQR